MKAAQAWKKLFNHKHIKEHYYEKLSNKTSVGLDKITPEKFESALDDNIDLICRKTSNHTYKFTRCTIFYDFPKKIFIFRQCRMPDPDFCIEITESLIAFGMKSHKIHIGFFQRKSKFFPIERMTCIGTRLHCMHIKKHGIVRLIHNSSPSQCLQRLYFIPGIEG